MTDQKVVLDRLALGKLKEIMYIDSGIAEKFANLSKNVIEHVINQFGAENGFLTFSGGKDSTVLLDLALKADPRILVVTIDTGYEYDETKKFVNSVVKERKLNHVWITPTSEEVKKVDEEFGSTLVKGGQYKCCKQKEPAMTRFLRENNFKFWVTGLRASETPFRKNLGFFQFGKPRKVNPIIMWDEDDVWSYIRNHNVQYNPLYDKGYLSLGCRPCTEDGFREGRANQGRFEDIGTDTALECGLHVDVKA